MEYPSKKTSQYWIEYWNNLLFLPFPYIECPLCKNYHAKNTYDWNDHAKNVHQMTATDMKNLQIVYSPMGKKYYAF